MKSIFYFMFLLFLLSALFSCEGTQISGTNDTFEALNDQFDSTEQNETIDENQTTEDSKTNVLVPVKLELYTKPSKITPSIPVEILGRIFDASNKEISGLEIEPVVIQPKDGFIIVSEYKNKFIFEKDGTWRAGSSVSGYPEINASIEINIDATPPVITITQPERGIELTGDRIVEVKGTVKEEGSGLKTFTINDTEVTLDENGNFTYSINSNQGMNIIKAVAIDNSNMKAKKIQSYYFSDVYYPFSIHPSSVSVNDALMLFLQKEFFDDGIHDVTQLDDLSSIMMAFLITLDLNTLIKNPIAQQKILITTFVANIKYIVFDKINLDASIFPIEGGLHFSATLPKFTAKVEIMPNPCLSCKTLEGYITADSIVISSDIMISLGDNAKLQASAVNTQTALNQLKWKSASADAGLAIDFLINSALSIFKNQFEDDFKKQIENEVPEIISNAVNQFVFDQSYELKHFIGTGSPITINLNSEISNAVFHDDGALLQMKGSITTNKLLVPKNEPLGSIGRASCLDTDETSAFPKLNELEIGMSDDLANEALFSIWWGNMLTLHITSADLDNQDFSKFGIDNVVIDTNFLLPPILTSCNQQEKLIVQTGDMYVKATFNLFEIPTKFEFYASLEANCEINIIEENNEKKIGFNIGEPTFFEIDFTSVSDNFKGNEDSLESLIKDKIIGDILKQISQKTFGGFPVPEINLSQINKNMPKAAILTVDIEDVLRVSGYTVVEGKLKE